MSQNSNVVVLDFLTNEVGLDVMAAATLVAKFVSAGHTSSPALWALTDADLKKVVPDAGHRRKIAAAIRRGPRKLESSPKKSRKNDPFASAAEPSKLEPCVPPEEVDLSEIQGTCKVNRSPVMVLWSAIVANFLGYSWEEALSLGSTVSALNAQSKASRIWGTNSADKPQPSFTIDGPAVEGIVLLGREVPACRTEEGIRGCLDGRAIHPKSAQDRLKQAFPGRVYAAVYTAMRRLALAAGRGGAFASDPRRAYSLYERFRPAVADGAGGWGAAGDLHIDSILRLAVELEPSSTPAALAFAPAGAAVSAAAAAPPPAAAKPRESDANLKSAAVKKEEPEHTGDVAAEGASGSGAVQVDATAVLAALDAGGAEGLTREALVRACGGGTGDVIDELQLEGVLFEAGGRLRRL